MSKKAFGQYLRSLRNDRGYSLRELASQIEITPYYLCYIENGTKSNPSIKVISRLFKTLKMNKNEIELFLDLHAKANDCVSLDIIQYIMEHDEIREAVRHERDKTGAAPNWNDFINCFMKNDG